MRYLPVRVLTENLEFARRLPTTARHSKISISRSQHFCGKDAFVLAQPEQPLYLSRANIEKTHAAIAPFVRRTPSLKVRSRDFGLSDFPLALKLETLQASGSYKARGAFANLLLRDVPKGGVTAASGGNHGVAVAYAARTLNTPCAIFVWSQTGESKRRRIVDFGADLRVVGDSYSEALAATLAYARESGAMPVLPFDAIETVLGAATVGLEIDDEVSSVDTVLVPVGGGGLIAGVISWFGSDAKIIAVEPEGACTLTRALAAGKPVAGKNTSIASDSMGPDGVGEMVFPIVKRGIDRVVLVSDDELLAAQRALWDGGRIVAEPGGAAAFAALHTTKYVPRPDERVAVIISGGNSAAVTF
ncbi:MAG: threonine/serine dehydratase [Candidatus Eremiobacteraeota bacterium]|nr:threonine/serine dehydratase [Candidatus Eremiobacteraeota bacterium]